MNHYTGYELLWLFFIYSFGGWVLETISATLKQRKFANRGLVNGPFCVLYGLTAIAMTVGLQELRGIWLFIFATVYATVAEWVSGHLIEKAFKARWWDYSNIKWNLDGYICLPASLFWGVLGYLAVRWCNGVTLILLHILPKLLMHIVLLTLIGVLFVDIFGSFMLLTGKSKKPERWIATDAGMDKISTKIAGKIAGSLEKRLKKAYPKARKIEEEIREENEEKVFAKGCGFYKIVMLFMIGAFLGDITETIFCRVTAGVWMSRSSVVWGPFSIVWGLQLRLSQHFCTNIRIKGIVFFSLQEHCLVVLMSISAVCLRNLYLEKCSGITARSRLIWEDELICFTVFSGELLQLYGLKYYFRQWKNG